jgi:hypothetical protein
MEKKLLGLSCSFVMLMLVVFAGPAGAASYSSSWNPPNVFVDEAHPYYFPLTLPGWSEDKSLYTQAAFEITYLDQSTDITIKAANPAIDPSEASNYNITIGAVPVSEWGASGTQSFDLLSTLDTPTFNALFKGQTMLYLVADCHYYFDKAGITLQTRPVVPIPSALILLGSGMLGLVGLRRASSIK